MGADGEVRLRAPDGNWRLLVTSPGGTHVSTVVVAELKLAGESRWECAYRTGRLDFARPADSTAEDQFYHRFLTRDGVLVLTPLPPDEVELRVPAGKGEIVRFELAVWSTPNLWPRVASVEVAPDR